MNNLPGIIKNGLVTPPWKTINFLVELNRSVSRLCKLTDTPQFQVSAKVSQPVTFASDRILIRVLIDNIIFTAVHNTNSNYEGSPLLDIGIWLDEMSAHLEVKKELFEVTAKKSQKRTLFNSFFRSFKYERKYNFGAALVENAINALQGKMEIHCSDSNLVLHIHIPNRAEFTHFSSLHNESVPAYHTNRIHKH